MAGKMRRALFTVTIVGTILSLLYLVEAFQYPRGTPNQPGPGFYPILIGFVLLVGFLGTGLESVISRSREEIDWPKGAARWRILSIALSSLAYVVMLPYLGHPLAGTLVTLVVLETMSLPSWPIKIGVALANGLGSYYLFSVLLGVPLPAGIWYG